MISKKGKTFLAFSIYLTGAVFGQQNTEANQQLEKAVFSKSVAKVKAAIKKGGDVNMIANEIPVPLLLAAVKSGVKHDIVAVLVKAGANVNASDPMGTTVLMEAAMKGDVKIINILIGAKADVNTKAQNGFTALEGARQMQKYGMINGDAEKVLLKAGATE